ncbi:MAG: hypothetical protein ACYDER_07705 [Ktedonobacteraceae bacterium]
MHIPLSDKQREALYEAQLASLQQGDEELAGTSLSTAEYGWWLLDGVVVRDESGKEQDVLAQQQ